MSRCRYFPIENGGFSSQSCDRCQGCNELPFGMSFCLRLCYKVVVSNICYPWIEDSPTTKEKSLVHLDFLGVYKKKLGGGFK